MNDCRITKPGALNFRQIAMSSIYLKPGFTLFIVVMVLIGGCALVPDMSQLDHMLREEGDRITYLHTGSIFGANFVTVRSVQRGEPQVNPRETIKPYLLFDKESLSLGSIDFTVLAHPDILEHLYDFQEPLAHQLKQSLELIRARDIPKSNYSMDILIRLMPLDSGYDYRKTSFYSNHPRFEFVGSVDVRSIGRFEYSLISVLETVHHELVHFSEDHAWINIPGENADERSTNEEAFATIVGRCDALILFNGFHGDRPRLRFRTEHDLVVPDPMALHASSNRFDHKLLGRIIGLEIFLEGVPRDRYLEAGEIQQMLDRCEALSGHPNNFQKMYFEHD